MVIKNLCLKLEESLRQSTKDQISPDDATKKADTTSTEAVLDSGGELHAADQKLASGVADMTTVLCPACEPQHLEESNSAAVGIVEPFDETGVSPVAELAELDHEHASAALQSSNELSVRAVTVDADS